MSISALAWNIPLMPPALVAMTAATTEDWEWPGAQIKSGTMPRVVRHCSILSMPVATAVSSTESGLTLL